MCNRVRVNGFTPEAFIVDAELFIIVAFYGIDTFEICILSYPSRPLLLHDAYLKLLGFQSRKKAEEGKTLLFITHMPIEVFVLDL